MHVGIFFILVVVIVEVGVAFFSYLNHGKAINISNAFVAFIITVGALVMPLDFCMRGAPYVPVAGSEATTVVQTYDLVEVGGNYLSQDTESMSYIFVAEDGTLQRAEADLGENNVSVSYVENGGSVTVTTKTRLMRKKCGFLIDSKESVEQKSYHFEIPVGTIGGGASSVGARRAGESTQTHWAPTLTIH